MDQLETKQLINESRLDRRYYFQSLFQEACKAGLFTETEIERIQLDMVELMGKEIERFTNDESSSVPVEKAQEILSSISYNIGYILKTTTDMTQKISILKTEKMSALFLKGMEAVSLCKSKADSILKQLQKSCLKLNNYAYHDTIFEGLPEFFHDYNIEFGADEIPASFDYPLFNWISDLLGVEYIAQYLNCLTLEDQILRHFSAETINRLLQGFDSEAEHILVNIFELVLINALGCSLLGQKINELEIREEELQYLQNNLELLERQELELKLESALIDMNQELKLEPEVITYVRASIPQIVSRLVLNLKTKTLGRLFIVFPEKQSEEVIYEDGIPMEDEKLRDLIDQLSSCISTSDKIELMNQHVKSMADFSELIEECFYEDEYDEVFHSLSENDKAVLHNILESEAGLEYDEKYEPPKLWQQKFLQIGYTKK